MAFKVSDKEIDRKLDEVRSVINSKFGIQCSKTDAIRFLLKIRKQGKKTSKKWKDII